jgi:hypothetical protein
MPFSPHLSGLLLWLAAEFGVSVGIHAGEKGAYPISASDPIMRNPPGSRCSSFPSAYYRAIEVLSEYKAILGGVQLRPSSGLLPQGFLDRIYVHVPRALVGDLLRSLQRLLECATSFRSLSLLPKGPRLDLQ